MSHRARRRPREFRLDRSYHDNDSHLIADDHPVVREGLAARALAGQADFAVVGVATDGEEAVRLHGELAPDVTLMDLQMPGLDGAGAIAAIRATSPGAHPGAHHLRCRRRHPARHRGRRDGLSARATACARNSSAPSEARRPANRCWRLPWPRA